MMDNPVERSDELLIGMPQIAAAVGVTGNAVSNWRRRHEDFPAPAVETPSGMLFNKGQVEAWLLENGKITAPIGGAQLLWASFNDLRGYLQPEESYDLLAALLALLADQQTSTSVIDRLTAADPTEYPTTLDQMAQEAAGNPETGNARVYARLSSGAALSKNVPPAVIIRLVRTLGDALGQGNRRRAAYEILVEAAARLGGTVGGRSMHQSPRSIARLLAALAQGAESVFDPACGAGGALLETALIRQARRAANREPNHTPRLTGHEFSDFTATEAELRAWILNIPIEVIVTDSFATLPPTGQGAVISSPPFGTRRWGNADVLTSERWLFGAPSVNNGDLAWPQMALNALEMGGRAFIILPLSTLTSGGQSRQIRSRMIAAGVVRAIVELPARLLVDTGIPLALWCLQNVRPERAGQILFVDASAVGTAGRSVVSMSEDETQEIVHMLGTWIEREKVVGSTFPINATTVPPQDIVDSNLLPRRYLLPTTPSREDLETRRDSLLAQIDEERALFDDQLNAVWKAFGGSQ